MAQEKQFIVTKKISSILEKSYGLFLIVFKNNEHYHTAQYLHINNIDSLLMRMPERNPYLEDTDDSDAYKVSHNEGHTMVEVDEERLDQKVMDENYIYELSEESKLLLQSLASERNIPVNLKILEGIERYILPNGNMLIELRICGFCRFQKYRNILGIKKVVEQANIEDHRQHYLIKQKVFYVYDDNSATIIHMRSNYYDYYVDYRLRPCRVHTIEHINYVDDSVFQNYNRQIGHKHYLSRENTVLKSQDPINFLYYIMDREYNDYYYDELRILLEKLEVYPQNQVFSEIRTNLRNRKFTEELIAETWKDPHKVAVREGINLSFFHD